MSDDRTDDDRTDTEKEQADLLETLQTRRNFLRHTVRDLSDAQARQQTTVSELCLGGLIKHVTAVEGHWVDFILNGAPDGPVADADSMAAHAATFRMEEGESLAAILERYAETARVTDGIIAGLGSFDQSQALPAAPWFEPGARWTARRVLLHIIAETSQHAGHADIIRESLDGAKTMG